MGRYDDQKIYRTFEEFEREELRREVHAGSVDEMLDDMFAGDLDFDNDRGRSKKANDDEDDE
jgi:archaellum component FlaC